MKTLKLFTTLSLALFISSGLMAQLAITVTNHAEGNLATEITAELSGGAVTDVTELIISGGNIDIDDAAAIKSCTNLETLDVSGVAFTGNTTPSLTSAASGMCNGLKKLETVTLPNTLTSIGAYAFFQCTELKNVNLNDDITTISQNAFQACGKLIMTSLPTNLETVGSTAFASSAITLTTLPESVKTIGGTAFSKCNNVTISKLPTNLTRLDKSAFEFCPVTISELPVGITVLNERVFDRASITDFTLPKTLESIGALTFYTGSDGKLGENPVRNFTCRKEALPTLADRSFGAAGKCDKTTIHILKKATGAAAYTTAGVTIAYLTRDLTVTIGGDGTGTVSVSGDDALVDPADAGTVENAAVLELYEGESASFTVEASAGSTISVKLDGETVTPETDGKTFIIDVDEKTTALNIEISKPTGIDANNDDAVSVDMKDNVLYVNGQLSAPIIVFNCLGQQVVETTNNTTDMSELNPGIYIVKTGKETFKVIKK